MWRRLLSGSRCWRLLRATAFRWRAQRGSVGGRRAEAAWIARTRTTVRGRGRHVHENLGGRTVPVVVLVDDPRRRVVGRVRDRVGRRGLRRPVGRADTAGVGAGLGAAVAAGLLLPVRVASTKVEKGRKRQTHSELRHLQRATESLAQFVGARVDADDEYRRVRVPTRLLEQPTGKVGSGSALV